MKQKRIALVIYALHEGGAEKVAAELSFYFAELQHQVTVVVFDDRHRVYEHGGQLVDLNLPAAEHSTLWSRFILLFRRARRLRDLYRQGDFDLIIAMMESAGFASVLASRDTVIANHCNPAEKFSLIEWWLAGRLFHRARKVVAVSKQGQRIFRQRLKLERLQTIYNPVAHQRIHQAANDGVAELAVAPRRPYMIALGRLEAVKRFDRLLEAYAASTARKHLDLLILGQGSLFADLQKHIFRLGLDDQAILGGYVDNPYPWLQQARFTVLSSDHEGFPMVLIESLSLGRPVIATDCPTGPDEIIRHEQNGLLVPVGDTAVLTEAMDRLAGDQQLYNKLADNALLSVEDLDISMIAEQWLQLCEPQARDSEVQH